MTLIDAAAQLRDALAGWPERAPIGSIDFILNPLEYAWELHVQYLERAAPPGHRVEAILVGMNPGPWGMAQTGVPFGSPDKVRGFLGLTGTVTPPQHMHPKRLILGLNSPRTEVSGQRLWGGIERCFGTPEAFFARFFIANYCPLAFQTESGANVTPDKLPKSVAQELEHQCDQHLLRVIETLKPRCVIGVGKWAEERARDIVQAARLPCDVGTIPHPSPANPSANRDWLGSARTHLERLGYPWPSPTPL